MWNVLQCGCDVGLRCDVEYVRYGAMLNAMCNVRCAVKCGDTMWNGVVHVEYGGVL